VWAELEGSAIIKASSQFWEQMLAMTAKPVPQPSKFCVGSKCMQASVGLSSAWSGSIACVLMGSVLRWQTQTYRCSW
jgi:hypothetical protein